MQDKYGLQNILGNLNKYRLPVFFCFIIFSQSCLSSQTDYFGIFDVDFDRRNIENSTVILSSINDIGDCVCDITQDTCDYLCCCDRDCPSLIIGKWLNDTNNICLDKQNSRNDIFTYCFGDNILYKFNRKRGMQEFRDPLSNLFCVTFDNSSVKDRFYTSIQSLNETLTRSIFKYYVDSQFKGNYFNSIANQTYIVGIDIYEVGDFLKVKYYNNSTLLIQDKFYLYNTGAFGECIRTEPLRFMRNIPKSSCGYKFKKFSDCEKHQWNSILNNNLTFFTHPLKSIGTIKPKINRVFFRDYESQNLTEYIGSDRASLNTTLNITDPYPIQQYCLCNNLLEQMTLNFIVDLKFWELKELYVDVILATNVKSLCNNRYVITQTYSTNYIENLSATEKSGNPGYLDSSILLLLKNSTTNSQKFQLYKDGYFLNGRNKNGTCINSTLASKQIINLNFDAPLSFKQNTLYSCYLNFTFTEFNNFCNNNKWKEISIFKMQNDINFIGKYGSSEIDYRSDWIEVLKESYAQNSTWSSDNRTCLIPSLLSFDILYDTAGFLNNKQFSIVNITFSGNQEIDTLLVNFKFGSNYISLMKDVLAESIENPSILPLLPSDIVTPFTNQLD